MISLSSFIVQSFLHLSLFALFLFFGFCYLLWKTFACPCELLAGLDMPMSWATKVWGWGRSKYKWTDGSKWMRAMQGPSQCPRHILLDDWHWVLRNAVQTIGQLYRCLLRSYCLRQRLELVKHFLSHSMNQQATATSEQWKHTIPPRITLAK